MSARMDRWFTGLFFHGQFFSRGWGDLAELREGFGLADTGTHWDDPATLAAFRAALSTPRDTAPIDIDWQPARRWPGGVTLRRGSFATPCRAVSLLPARSRVAHVEEISPDTPAEGRPACVLFAATGEQGFGTRRLLALALAQQGITSVILENAYYGVRRPDDQRAFFQNRVVDLLAMFDSSVSEGRALLAWLHRNGHERLAVGGISMGGTVSALVAAQSDFPVSASCLIPASSVGPAYAEGVIGNHVDWDRLRTALREATDPRRLLIDYLSVYDVRALPRPTAESSCTFLSATDDGCIPRHATDGLHHHWPLARVEWIGGGHTPAAVLGWNRFRRAIIQGLTDVPAPGRDVRNRATVSP